MYVIVIEVEVPFLTFTHTGATILIYMVTGVPWGCQYESNLLDSVNQFRCRDLTCIFAHVYPVKSF